MERKTALIGIALVSAAFIWVLAQKGQDSEASGVAMPEDLLRVKPQTNEGNYPLNSGNMPVERDSLSVQEPAETPPAIASEATSNPEASQTRTGDSRDIYDLPIYHWQGEFPRLSPDVYSGKYLNDGLAALEQARHDLSWTFRNDVRAAFAEKLAEGDYQTIVLQYKTEHGVETPIGLDMHLVGDTPLFSVISSQDSSGNQIRDFFWLPPDDAQFYDLYLSLDELQWVSGQIYTLGASESLGK